MRTSGKKQYRLILDEDGRGVERVIEFEANGAESALAAIERHCDGREAQVFENGRLLGRIRNERRGGFWLLTPPALAPILSPSLAGGIGA